MSLVSTNEKLFDSKEYSDITFIIDKKELQAHQFILVHRSPVLKAMIKGPMAPATQRHPISDPQVSYDTFSNFLKFLYTDKIEININNVEVLLHLSKSTNLNTFINLISSSGHMYDVSYLFEICVNELPKFFHKIDPVKFAEIGLFYDNKCNIVVKCLNELPQNLLLLQLKYSNGNEMVWISPELVIEFIKHCNQTKKFNENVVFEKVFDWVNGKCEERNLEINAKNLKEIMAPFEPYIQFEKMDIKILTSTVYEYELIPEKRLLKCFRDHIVKKEDGPKRVTFNDTQSIFSRQPGPFNRNIFNSGPINFPYNPNPQ